MADTKISALTASTTPLAGTEVLPIVQSGTTVKVSVANLTAGRSVSAADQTLSAGNLVFSSTAQRITADFNNATVANRLAFQNSTANSATNVGIIPNGTTKNSGLQSYNNSDPTNASSFSFGITNAGATARIVSGITGTGTYLPIEIWTNNAARLSFATSGDVTVNTGNVIQGTAAKGVNFTANTPAAGMTSQLLNWYEEGTWTPADNSGAVTITVNSATYVRIGRLVTLQMDITYPTTASGAVANLKNLPFTPANNSGGGLYCNSATGITGLQVTTGSLIYFQTTSGNNATNVQLTGNVIRTSVSYQV